MGPVSGGSRRDSSRHWPTASAQAFGGPAYQALIPLRMEAAEVDLISYES